MLVFEQTFLLLIVKYVWYVFMYTQVYLHISRLVLNYINAGTLYAYVYKCFTNDYLRYYLLIGSYERHIFNIYTFCINCSSFYVLLSR